VRVLGLLCRSNVSPIFSSGFIRSALLEAAAADSD
jgi:hypothetical protein